MRFSVTRFFRRTGLIAVDAILGVWLAAPIIGIADAGGLHQIPAILLGLVCAAAALVGLQTLATSGTRGSLVVTLALISIAGWGIDILLSVIGSRVGLGKDLAIIATLLVTLYTGWVAVSRIRNRVRRTGTSNGPRGPKGK